MKIEKLDAPREIIRACIELAKITSPSALMEVYKATHDGDSVVIVLAPGSSRAIVYTNKGFERFYDVKTAQEVVDELIAR